MASTPWHRDRNFLQQIQYIRKKNHSGIAALGASTFNLGVYDAEFVLKKNMHAGKNFAPKLTGKLTGVPAEKKVRVVLTETEATECRARTRKDLETALRTPVGEMVCLPRSTHACNKMVTNGQSGQQ